MSYTKDGNTYEAEQTKEGRFVNIFGQGDVTVPAGYWVVTNGKVIVDCPSDDTFKMNYTTATVDKPKPKKNEE